MTFTTEVGCIFGEQHVGKSSLVAATYPDMLGFGVASAIQVASLAAYGFEPQVYPHVTINGEAVDLSQELADGDWEPPATVRDLNDQSYVLQCLSQRPDVLEHFSCLYFDDETLTTQAWVEWARQQAELYGDAEFQTGSGATDIRGIYGKLTARSYQKANEWSHMGMPIWCSAHVIEGQRGSHPTQPKLGSANLGPKITAWYDMILWMQADSEALDPWFKRKLYRDSNELKKVITKDRNEVAWASTPANLRAILTASSSEYDLRRLSGLEWQDDVMQEISQAVLDSEADRRYIGGVIQTAFKEHAGFDGIPGQCSTNEQRHVRWAVQDGLALGQIKLRSQRETVDSAWFASDPSDSSNKKKGLPGV